MADNVDNTDRETTERRETVVVNDRDRGGRSNTGLIVALVILALLILLFVWNPFGGGNGNGGDADVDVQTPTTNVE